MFGVAVSMLLYERRHLTTGSIVVPGYIATFIAMPFTILATFLNAFVSYWLINKVLRRWFLLYGRTKFTVLASTSILIQTLMLKFSPVGSWLWEKDFKLLVGVGYVVPALIAHDMGRQGIKKTIKSVMLAGLIVAAPIGLALLVHLPGVNDLAPLRGGFDSAVDVGWIPIAVLFSAAAAWGVARTLGSAQRRLHGGRLHRHPARRSRGRSSSPPASAPRTYLLVKRAADELDDPVRTPQVLGDAARLGVAVVEPAVAGEPHLRDRHPEPHGHRLAGADAADRARAARQRRPTHVAAARAGRAPRWRRRSCCR